MSKKAMYDLRNMLCDELDELARKGELGAGDLEIAHKLTDTIKNIDKICMGEGYSRRSEWDAEGFMRGNSYKRDSMGRYSRDDGYSRRNYSRADESEHAIEQLEEMLKTAGGESEHMAIKKAISILKNA